jgi:hypothetical protein
VEDIMRSNGRLCLLLGVLLVAVPLPSQNVNLNRPQEIESQRHTAAEDRMARADSLQLQKDTKELAGLCASVSEDMDHVREGLLSKDSLEKLKRLEKLSKRVREELTQASTAH